MSFSLADKHYICGFSAMVNEAIESKCKLCGMDTVIDKPLKYSGIDEMLKLCKRTSNIVGLSKLD